MLPDAVVVVSAGAVVSLEPAAVVAVVSPVAVVAVVAAVVVVVVSQPLAYDTPTLAFWLSIHLLQVSLFFSLSSWLLISSLTASSVYCLASLMPVTWMTW